MPATLTHLSSGLTTLFGASATLNSTGTDGGTSIAFTSAATAEVLFNVAQLGTGGDMPTGSAEFSISAEGIVLAFMQNAFANQGSSASAALEILQNLPSLVTRGLGTVRKDSYVVNIYSVPASDNTIPTSV